MLCECNHNHWLVFHNTWFSCESICCVCFISLSLLLLLQLRGFIRIFLRSCWTSHSHFSDETVLKWHTEKRKKNRRRYSQTTAWKLKVCRHLLWFIYQSILSHSHRRTNVSELEPIPFFVCVCWLLTYPNRNGFSSRMISFSSFSRSSSLFTYSTSVTL